MPLYDMMTKRMELGVFNLTLVLNVTQSGVYGNRYKRARNPRLVGRREESVKEGWG